MEGILQTVYLSWYEFLVFLRPSCELCRVSSVLYRWTTPESGSGVKLHGRAANIHRSQGQLVYCHAIKQLSSSTAAPGRLTRLLARMAVAFPRWVQMMTSTYRFLNYWLLSFKLGEEAGLYTRRPLPSHFLQSCVSKDDIMVLWRWPTYGFQPVCPFRPLTSARLFPLFLSTIFFVNPRDGCLSVKNSQSSPSSANNHLTFKITQVLFLPHSLWTLISLTQFYWCVKATLQVQLIKWPASVH